MLVHPGRCLWRCFGAACLALWFIVITMDPTAVHTCPMHDGSAALAHMAMAPAALDAPAAASVDVHTAHAKHTSHAAHSAL